MTQATGEAPYGETPIAIFVNTKEPSLARLYEYGLPVKRAVASAVLELDSSRKCQFQTSWGSLVLPALRWASASSEPAGAMALTPDPFLLWTSAAELCRKDAGRWSTLGSHVPWLLGSSDIYVGALSRWPNALRSALDDQLRVHGWYIGALEIALHNPLHQRVFSLVPGWRYSHGWVDQPPDSISAQELFAGTNVNGIGLDEHPIHPVRCEIPWTLAPVLHLPQATLGSMAARQGRTYQEAIAELVHQYTDAERPLTFTVGRQQPVVEDLRGKLHDYALNPDHEVGQHKARVFKSSLGIEQRDWKLLAIQLISALQSAQPRKFRDGKWGTQQQFQFEITSTVAGLNGRTAFVTSGWQIRDDEPVQLVTVVPGDKASGADLAGLAPGDWSSLYNMALTVADRAQQECRPTPIIVRGPGGPGGPGGEVIPEGLAGFAWVRFPDTSSPFVQWLLRNGHALEDDPNGAQICAPIFYLEPAGAWAEAMASILQAAGHPCSVDQVVD